MTSSNGSLLIPSSVLRSFLSSNGIAMVIFGRSIARALDTQHLDSQF